MMSIECFERKLDMDMKTSKTIDFRILKQEVVKLISNAELTIKAKDSSRESGIYLLYVDNFQDDKIIPFYIGKTNNFQRRFCNHLKDVKDLIDNGYADYCDKIFWNAVSHRRYYEGKYRPCKILKYIVDHDCTVDDIKMVVLEKCIEEKLDEREQYFLSEYLPAFFGFNQIATITERSSNRDNPEKMRKIIKDDYQNFLKYMEYGYSTFNYLHAFSYYGSDELNKIVNKITSNHLWPTQEELFLSVNYAYENYRIAYNEAYEKIKKIFSSSVHEIFETYKFKSKGREEQVISVFTNHYQTDVFSNCDLVYLNYYFNRDKRSRLCGKMIKDLFNEHKDTIKEITLPLNIAFEAYIKSRQNAIEYSEYSFIFPLKRF